RTTQRVSFTDDDRQHVYALGSLVSGMLLAHYRLLDVCPQPLAAEVEPHSVQKAVELSPREKAVLSLILVGQTNEAIALDQGVSINTIKTYRKRLYRKLGVSTLNELHARYGRSVKILKPRQPHAIRLNS
ncbi:MAG: helix-turn-helix transcriptional regulator, partial [Pigmentiphaga sp.]